MPWYVMGKLVTITQDSNKPHIFYVSSASNPFETYTVNLFQRHCTCKGWEFAKDKSWVGFALHKHTAAVLRLVAEKKMAVLAS